MKLPRFFLRFSHLVERPNLKQTRLQIEALESRLAPYAASGNVWPHPELVSLSFMPDTTNLGGVTSNLFNTMNSQWAPSVWQREILRAAQVWAQVTNLNFALVSDNGADSGSGAYQQGASGFGDIRVGAYNSGGSNLGSAMMPPPANNYSVAGDFALNSAQPWVINQTGGYDLFTVASHEIGHSLGLYHSTVSSAQEYSFYNAIKSSLRSDDIAGIRAIYSGGQGRSADAFDASQSNNSFATATSLTSVINPTTKTALVENLDLTTTSDTDYYSFVAPTGSASTLTVNVQSNGLSMLMPTVTVYDAQQQQVGSISGLGQYGSTLSVNIGGVTEGQLFYVKVTPAETSAFGTGKYALTLNLGTGASPTVPLPNTQTANGSPIRGGGGVASRDGIEERVNSTTEGQQRTFSDLGNRNAVAMSGWGSYVVTWASQGQDGSGSGVYARIYGPDGVPWSGEFQVNTYTTGDQLHAVVAMDDYSNFVIAWASQGQDSDGSWGIRAQRFDYLGQPLGSEFAVANGSGDQKYPAIATSWDGRFVISWTDAALDGNGSGVGARVYGTDGQPLTSVFLVNTTTANEQTKPAVAMDLYGNFAVAWISQDPGTGENVYAKLYDAAGQVVHDEFLVNTTTAGLQDSPALAMADDGDFVATWSSYGQDGSGWGVYAQRFTLDGLPRDGEFLVNDNTAGDQWYSAVAMFANGEAVITWTELDAQGSTVGIFAQQFNAAGAPVGAEFIVNTTTTGNQWYPSIAASNSDGFVSVWSGEGVGDMDGGVFLQRYQYVSISGGIVEAEDDFYGISEHGNGCGYAVCQAAAGTPVVDHALLPADAAPVQALLSNTGDAIAVHSDNAPIAPAPGETVRTDAVASNDVTAESTPRNRIHADALPPATAFLESGPAAAVPSDLAPQAPVESQETAAPAALPGQPDASPWTLALDRYFAEEAAAAVHGDSTKPLPPTSEFAPANASITPLAGLGLLLGGLWIARPEPTTKREPRRSPAL